MHELILVDKATGREIGRRPMAPQERYAFYRLHMKLEPLLFQGVFYTTHSVAWRIPEEDFVAGVTFHSYDRSCE